MELNQEEAEKIAQLYEETYPLLMSYAGSVMKNESKGEEAVQETFRIACMKPDKLLESENPRGWLTNTLKNVMYNMNKSQIRTKKMMAGYLQDEDLEMIGKCDEIDIDILYSDLAEREEFKLIKMIVFEDMSILEVAERLNISVEACSKRIQRAKKKLRKKLKGRGK